jgi:hypothetical protein
LLSFASDRVLGANERQLEDNKIFVSEDESLLAFSVVSSISYLKDISDFIENELGMIGLDENDFFVDYVVYKTKFRNGVEIIGKGSIPPSWIKEKPMNMIMHHEEKFVAGDILPLIIGLENT